jgi:hypothetical protein
MRILQLLTFLSFLSGMLNSGLLTQTQRRLYLKQFAAVLAELRSTGPIYLPPWIRRLLIMSGMRSYAARRLLCLKNGDFFDRSSRTSFKFYDKIISPSCDFSRYENHIFCPSRLVVKSFSDMRCYAPIGCCWHAGLGKLLVTTAQHIFVVDVDGHPRFKILYSLPGGNNYGIDVATDGTIALSCYNANQVTLLSPQGKLISNYVILANRPANMTGLRLTYSGVSFSHDDSHILCFSNLGIHILRRDGTFLCTIGGKGSRPGFFSCEGQFCKLSEENQFAVSDIEMNRIQIIEIDFERGTMKVLKIFGMNFFFKPLGLVQMGNCFVVFSHEDGCAYIWDGERYFQVMDRQFFSARFACKLPGGRIALCNQLSSVIHILNEDNHVPTGTICLDISFRKKPNNGLTSVAYSAVETSDQSTQVADSEVETSDQSTQVADSSAQADVRITIVADSSVQTNSPTLSIFRRFLNQVNYFLGYQLF